VVFDDATVDLGKAGGFPSDLVRAPDGRLITVDDATIPARVLVFPAAVGGATPSQVIPITAADLIDHDGTTPARAPTAFGNGLFGAFTGTLELVFDRWLLVTVGAGNSVSDDGSVPLHLANLVVIDLDTGTIVQTVNLAWALQTSGTFSHGAEYVGIPQSLPSMTAFVPDRSGTQTGKVFVAMSNGAGSSAGLQTFFNGTVQSWKADFTRAKPLAIDTTGKAPADVTRTYVSTYYNPVGLTRHTTATGFSTLVLTDAGASRFTTSFAAVPTTDAVLEFLDLDSGQWRDTWTANLGPILPAPQGIASFHDGSGNTRGLITSQTYAAAYLLDLSGLDSNPVDASRLGLLRTIDLAPGGSSTAGSGFQAGVAVNATGRTGLVTSFTTSKLTVIGLPVDPAFGPILVDPAPFDTVALGPARGLGLGAVVFTPGAAADAVFLVNGNFDQNFVPNRNAFLGTLAVTATIP